MTNDFSSNRQKKSITWKSIRRAAILTGILTVTAVIPPSVSAVESYLPDDKLKAIVKEVIRENPKLILDTLQQYQADQKKKQQERQLESSFKTRIEDTVSAHNPQKGPADAPVTIVEYTDFQCPYCARGAQALAQVLKRYPDQVRVVFKNLPLKMHAQAENAARAALSAQKQGKFWEYHDRLFQKSARLKDNTYAELAAELGLNVERFNSDMASEEIAGQLRSDMDRAKTLKIAGTPRFLVNGVQIKGAYPPDYFAKVIDRLLAEEDGRRLSVNSGQ